MRNVLFHCCWIGLLSTIMISCKNISGLKNSQKNDETSAVSEKGVSSGPPAIIYKTKQDYYDKVPVILSDDKLEIESYPGIKDVFFKGELAYPTHLDNGFLLDNRGINKNAAFLKMTYEEYSKLDQTPSKDELFRMILDNDPFTVMYSCGSKFKYKNIVDELNQAINENKLSTFEKLK